MISLFISDIDGCLSEPYRPYDLPRFDRLARDVRRAGGVGGDDVLPAFSLCTGRAYPYMEAVSQVLGLQVPGLFESGGGMFDPVAARVTWNPYYTDDIAAQMEELRHWLIHDVVPGSGMMFDYGKRTQVGIIGPDTAEVGRYVPRVEEHVAGRYPELDVFHTEYSIDVLARKITKRQEIEWLSEELGVPVAEMAYIGDANGDIDALRLVGHSFAPANAAPPVRDVVQHVTEGRVLEGVLEAYGWCCGHNERRTADAA